MRVRCVYCTDFVDLPTYSTVKCMRFQAVKGTTARCPWRRRGGQLENPHRFIATLADGHKANVKKSLCFEAREIQGIMEPFVPSLLLGS